MGNKAKAMIRPTLVLLKGLQAAGDIAPLPYIKGIAALAITILELVDNAFTNNRDIQELVERIGNTVTAVNDVAVTYSRIGSEDMSSIEELCADFHRCLEAIIGEVREMERNNANRGRIMQYLMTPNIREEINAFVRQVDNMQRNFNTKNILRICANNEVSDSYLRALEHGMRELRAEHSDMNRTLTLLLVSHNEIRTQVSNQGGLPVARSRIAKRNRSGGTIVIQSTVDPRYMSYYLLLATLSTTLFWTMSCFTNFLPTPSNLYSQRARIRRYISPCTRISTSGHIVQRCKHRHGPRRKALCIGINYFGRSDQLKGCINDARSIREFLIYYCNYKAWDIAMLTDDSPDPRQHPTRKNIIDAMNWLVNVAQSGDTLLFFYAGSGRQVCTERGNKVDGYEEAILPVDYDQHDDILHEEMYHIMIRPLPTGCHLTVLLSCCHSAGALDLPYVYDSDTHLMSPRPLTSPKLTAADVVIWSGGKDMAVHETVVGGVAVSAFNYAFISSLKMNPKQSCRELLHSLRNRLAARHHSEKPQLVTSSRRIDPDLPATL
ncbi:caspase domain-containing protein [Armillaria borealis]|uniref:Caspase domain-containing protein n=1 Tax=Armillaria borealis TaxID=47425 RepID=A0AA39IVT8_9AGAR|nr:caspase domain-containing protein [Armillaria borealis]